jgi:abortive infection Abi-like protein
VKDLISPGTRGLFRNLMTDSSVNTISSAFHDEGFAANPACTYEDSSVRRVTAQEQLDRIQRAIIDDPALAIGSAKELVESTAKVVLIERGRTVNEKDDLPALARAAQEALGLHPSSTTPGPDGSDAVKKILGAVSTIATSLGELRNRGYGTGHGPAAARVGLRARHAHLAVNAAVTWCQLLLDTLADPDAPWHENP